MSGVVRKPERGSNEALLSLGWGIAPDWKLLAAFYRQIMQKYDEKMGRTGHYLGTLLPPGRADMGLLEGRVCLAGEWGHTPDNVPGKSPVGRRV
jgi:hypothetical protein